MPTPATFGQPGQWPGRLRGRLLIIRWESRTWTRSASPRLGAGGCLDAMAPATASDAGRPCQRYLYAGVPGPHFLGGQQDGYVLGRAGALDTVLLCLSFPDSAGVAGGCAAAGRTCASSTVSAGSSEPRGVELGARGRRVLCRALLCGLSIAG